MQITSFHAPTNGGTVYWGTAQSTRRRRYIWHAFEDGRCYVFREHPESGFFLGQPKAHPSLARLVRERILS